MLKKLSLPIGIAIILFIVSLITFILYYNNWNNEEVTISNPTVSKVQEKETIDLKSIIYESEKSVMQIEAQNDADTLTGSGFLYNDKGDIITNAHVVQDADLIYVRTVNARVYPAAVIGVSDDIDIAVIRVPQLADQGSLPIENQDIAEVGDEVIALGSPHGFQNTVTLGIISGKERKFSVDGIDYNNVYQISAQITHGNSGGPLINRNSGKVIGVNSVGTEDGTIGFSIPTNDFIDTIKSWSNETLNEDLNFASITDTESRLNPNELVKDAEYIIEYFIESINNQGYVDAYAILGDSLQKQLSYSDFRDNYINIIDMKYDKMDSELIEESQVLVTANISVEKKDEGDQKVSSKKEKLVFKVGYENDQLKIFSLPE